MDLQQISIQKSALGWVRKAIDDYLSEIRSNLNRYQGDYDDDLIEEIKRHLILINGVLTMVEQFGAAMLTEEMVALCDFLIEEDEKRKDAVLEVLLRSVLQLPDYIERIQSGLTDLPLVILPLLNDIRAVQNKDLFSEKLLFLPDLSAGSSTSALDISDSDIKKTKIYAKKIRPVYQFSLLSLIKEKDVSAQFSRLETIALVMQDRAITNELTQFWSIFSALIESLSRAELEVGVSIKMLLGKVDGVLKSLITSGEVDYIKQKPIELIKNLLYYIAQPDCCGPKSLAIKTAYQLDRYLPSESEREEIIGAINGPNHALLSTVGESVKNDIETVKSTLEVYVNGDLKDVSRLAKVPEELHVISDTLAMVGMGAQREIIESKRQLIQTILDGTHEPNEEELLQIAQDLLTVEDGLDNINKIQTAHLNKDEIDESDFEFDNVLLAVVTATLDDVQKIKTAILDYINDHSKTENLTLCVSLLNESKGAMDLLGQNEMAEIMEKLSSYINAADAGFLSDRRLELLSDVVISIEFFLEALGEKRDDSSAIALHADAKLIDLLKDVDLAEPQVQEEDLLILDDDETSNDDQEKALDLDDESSNNVVESISTELDEIHEVLEPIVAIDNVKDGNQYPELRHLQIPDVNEGLVVLGEDADPDILEIYIEEADEEAVNIQNNHKLWKNDLDNQELIANIRRSFHTIKGSGRLVGALFIGEFAWDYEELLNRIVDKTIKINPDIIQSIGYAAQALPELVAQIEKGSALTHDVSFLRGAAQFLAAYDAEKMLLERKKLKQEREQKESEKIDSDITIGSDDSGLEIEEVPDLPAIEEISADLEEIKQDLELPEIIIEEPEPDFDISSDENDLEITFETVEDDSLEITIDDENENGEGPPDPFVEASLAPEPVVVQEGEITSKKNDAKLAFNQQDSLIDSELFAIYQEEVQQHINKIHAFLDDMSIDEYFDPTEMYRSLHTVNGASKTAQITSVGEFASAMEKPLKVSIEAHEVMFDHDAHQLYMQGATQLSLMINELDGATEEPKYSPELYQEFGKLSLNTKEDNSQEASSQPEEHSQRAVQPQIETIQEEPDAELIEIFLEEANDLLNDSDSALFKWKTQIIEKKETDSINTIMEIQRYLHTLKGGARMASFKAIGDLSHEMESLFIDVLDNYVDINIELMDVLNECFDLLANMVECAGKHQPLPEYKQALETITNIRKGNVSDGVTPIPDSRDESLDAAEESAIDEFISDESNKSKEVIRVRSDLLDNLVNSAGEVSIYRSRMQQQVSSVNNNLGELDQTIVRLKNQLRDLEAETDAQILYSHKDSDAGDEDYDPLEMDRYTKMQELSKSLAESVEDLSSLKLLMGEQLKGSETLLLQQSRINGDLQDGLIRSRMVKFSGLISRLRRIVRQASGDLAKKVELVLIGEEHEIDNKVLDRMLSPLEHLLRNAIAHGIETPIERVKKGKNETGTITIEVKRESADIVIVVSDDGSGIDKEKVRRRALQLGIIEDLSKVQDQDLINLILEPGFSTEDKVTQISGRGVGMDVVDTEVKQLGGVLNISTVAGEGTTFTAKLPFTLSVNQAILIEIGEENYAIPLINIEGISRVDNKQLASIYKEENPSLEYADNAYELHYLAPLLDIRKEFKFTNEKEKQPIILARAGEIRIAIQVDKILGNREIVVKSLGKQLSQVKALSGASILGDGRIVFILDVSGLVKHGINTQISIDSLAPDIEENSRVNETPTVMVVDDSITMRRVAQKLLGRNNFAVVTAKDGIDALSQLEEVKPDIMLLDIEMPRMDGFELATHMKNDDLLNQIPIIMVTSRTGDKHRNHANDIGVERYMGKPYQEAELLENIHQLLEAV